MLTWFPCLYTYLQFVDSDIVIEKAPKEEESGFDPLFMAESYSLLR